MQQQQPSSKMAHQGLVTRAAGIWYYKCRICLEVFTSSQGLVGHQRKHMSQGTWIRVPHVVVPSPAPDPLLIQVDLFVRRLNQQIPYGNRLNVNLLLASTPIESISLPIESSGSITVSAEWMREKENKDKEVEQSSSVTISADWMCEKESKDQEAEQSSSITVTADWMREKENDDQEVEQLD
uniref:C2H2-type domain-containing protein n=1 Tax=Solanum tuberosum TaxID=4113 RepID=M1D9H4_SOLTU